MIARPKSATTTSDSGLSITVATLRDAVIVRFDILERLVRPDIASALMRRLAPDSDGASIVRPTLTAPETAAELAFLATITPD